MNNINKIATIDGVTNIAFDALTYSQKQKFNYLSSIYDDKDALLKLVKLIDGRGRNSWTKVNAKIAFINDADRDTQRYLDALYDNFEVGKTYTSDQVISVVADVRRDLGLLPYITRLKRYCEEDFFALFIIHEKSETISNHGAETSKFIGYVPMFKLKPED